MASTMRFWPLTGKENVSQCNLRLRKPITRKRLFQESTNKNRQTTTTSIPPFYRNVHMCSMKVPASVTEISARPCGRNEVIPQAVRSREANPYKPMCRRARLNNTSIRHLHNNKATPVQAIENGSDTCTVTRQHQLEQLYSGNSRPRRKNKLHPLRGTPS